VREAGQEWPDGLDGEGVVAWAQPVRNHRAERLGELALRLEEKEEE
jgi:hypothetical protein